MRFDQIKIYQALLYMVFTMTACAPSAVNSSHNTNASLPEKTEARVQLREGRVSFVPPANLKPLTKEQIAASKFSRTKPPQYVFANDSQTVSVAVTFDFMELAPDQLSDYKEANEQLLSRAISNVRWFAREIIEINGRKWVHMEVESDDPEYDLHNHQYTTSFEGKALVFGFNSTAKEYPQIKEAFIKSAQTIEVKD
jgi:hypothetical protein